MRALRPADLARLALGLALAATALSAWVWKVGAPVSGDASLARHVQSIEPLQRNAGWVNAAGDYAWWVLIVVAAWLALQPRLAKRREQRTQAMRRAGLVGFAAAAVLGFGSAILKAIVDSPRPMEALGIHIQGSYSGNGFPSGHVYGDMLVYGVLAVFARGYLPRWAVLPVRALCIAVIVLAGAARVAVGAHWPSDTAGGYLWGGAALCLALAVAKRWGK